MRSMEAYPRAAMERAMKVQDVMLQAMAKKITWWQAAEILGISDRHTRRWRERYVEEGYNGLLDRRRGETCVLWAVGASPPLPRIVPAFTASSWIIAMASMNSLGGGGPCFSACLTNIMNRIRNISFTSGWELGLSDRPGRCEAWLY